MDILINTQYKKKKREREMHNRIDKRGKTN